MNFMTFHRSLFKQYYLTFARTMHTKYSRMQPCGLPKIWLPVSFTVHRLSIKQFDDFRRPWLFIWLSWINVSPFMMPCHMDKLSISLMSQHDVIQYVKIKLHKAKDFLSKQGTVYCIKETQFHDEAKEIFLSRLFH